METVSVLSLGDINQWAREHGYISEVNAILAKVPQVLENIVREDALMKVAMGTGDYWKIRHMVSVIPHGLMEVSA